MKKWIAIILAAVLMLTVVAMAQPGKGFNGRRGMNSQRSGRSCCGMCGCSGAGTVSQDASVAGTASLEGTFSLEQLRAYLDVLVTKDEITRKQADLILNAFKQKENVPETYTEDAAPVEELPDEEPVEFPEEAFAEETVSEEPMEENTEEETGAFRSRGGSGKYRGIRGSDEPTGDEEVIE